jgi:hypothetical protein
MVLSDEEIKKRGKAELDPAGFIRLTFLRTTPDPENNIKLARHLEAQILGILSEASANKFNVLVDILLLGKGGKISPQARKVYAGLMRLGQVDKIAILGKSLLLKIMIDFITTAAGKTSKIKWFEQESEAIKWLK